MMLDRIVEVFSEVDDFCQAFLPQREASLLGPGGPAPRAPQPGLSQRGKRGWFFGFKRPRVSNNRHEIVALKLTPGNVHDTTPVPALTRELIGKLFGDKGYIGQKLAEDLLRRGLTLFTRVRKNMKSLPLSLQDKALLNARNMAETIIGHIKEFSSLNLSKHRSAINAFVHIIAAITAYQINPFKPKLNLQPRYQLETTA